MPIRRKRTFNCRVTVRAAFDFSVNMINDFLKDDVNFSASFMVNTRNITQVLRADIAEKDLRESDGLFSAGVFGLAFVFTFAFTVTSRLT
jgi:archaeosine-15-forming tRNA-guanine transglycosylase